MKFTLNDLILELLNMELDNEKKANIIERITTTGRINDGLYLRKNQEGKLECWFRNIDENGVTDHGPTGYDVEDITREIKSELNIKTI